MNEARDILRKMAGNTHSLLSAVVDASGETVFVEEARMKMRALDPAAPRRLPRDQRVDRLRRPTGSKVAASP